jgi:dTDP-glucose 4,6-dehydratase
LSLGDELLKVLVSGGAGFIGSHFVEWTLQNRVNVEVTVLDKLTYASVIGRPAIEKLGVGLIQGDICDVELVEQLVEQHDLVVNFAAESHNDNAISNPLPFYETNLMGTLNLAQACKRFNKRLHHVSTDEVFGDTDTNSSELFTESTPYNPSSPYSASKAAADQLIRAWVRTFKLQATISNCSNNYGPRQHPEKLIPRSIELINRGLNPQLYGNGSNIRDWIHVLDHVEGIWAILDKGKVGETYLLGATCEKSNLEVIQLLNRAFGRDENEIDFIQDRPGHDRRYAIDWSKARRELDWLPRRTDFETQLLELVSLDA